MFPPRRVSYMATARGGGVLLRAIRVDLRRLHDGWMGIAFPRQHTHNVLGRWRPETTPGLIAFWLWYAIGAPLVGILYPFVLAGFVIRFYAVKLDSTARRLGIIGVVGVFVIGWGLLTLVALIQLPTDAFIAVLAAAIVAVISAALAFVFARFGGRATTVILAYPFAMTALFLPPVVAALVTPALEPYVLEPSYDFAVWILNNLLAVGDINAYLRENYTLEGVAYAAMWVGIAVPIGWLLGILVTLANVVRPKDRAANGQSD